MTKCIATVGDVFVGTKDNIYVEDIDKCDSYSYDDLPFLGRSLIIKGEIYEEDGEIHFSVPFKCKPLSM